MRHMKSAAIRDLAPDQHAARAASPTAVRLLVDLPTVRDRLRRRLALAVIALLVLASSYLILAVTLAMVSQPINGTIFLINRVGITDGTAPPGTTLLMDLDNNGSTWSQRWRSTTWHIRHPIVVEVVSPPPTTTSAEGSTLTTNRTSPPQDVPLDSAALYLVTCRAGACTPGTILLVPAANTIGTVEATISF